MKNHSNQRINDDLESVIVLDGLRIHRAPKCTWQSVSRAVKFNANHAAGLLKTAFPDEEGPEFRFMVTRNPYDRAVSMWRYMTYKMGVRNFERHTRFKRVGYQIGDSFEQFMLDLPELWELDIHTAPQVWYTGPFKIDYLVQLDNVAYHWDRVREKFPDLDLGPYGHWNKTDRGDWREYYTPETKRIIEELYSEDFDLYESAHK